jgi:lipopolysaccharide export system protein LptA
MDVEKNTILLDTSARYWDGTGSLSADRIRMDQNTGDTLAEGNVNSSRLPDKDPKKNSEMFTSQEPLQAQSKRMEARNRGLWMRYEGGAAMWQGGNRIQADTIEVDRDKRTLTATGNVVTDIWEQPKKQAPSGTAAAIRTVVRAPRLVYTEENRLAYYTGGVTLMRPRLTVASNELRAYLAESG